jgi:hypothetical protein
VVIASRRLLLHLPEARKAMIEKDYAPAKRQGSYWLHATMNGDVRVDVYDEDEQPILFFIIPRASAQEVARQLVSLANMGH